MSGPAQSNEVKKAPACTTTAKSDHQTGSKGMLLIPPEVALLFVPVEGSDVVEGLAEGDAEAEAEDEDEYLLEVEVTPL